MQRGHRVDSLMFGDIENRAIVGHFEEAPIGIR
jgi:hypothetical protein